MSRISSLTNGTRGSHEFSNVRRERDAWPGECDESRSPRRKVQEEFPQVLFRYLPDTVPHLLRSHRHPQEIARVYRLPPRLFHGRSFIRVHHYRSAIRPVHQRQSGWHRDYHVIYWLRILDPGDWLHKSKKDKIELIKFNSTCIPRLKRIRSNSEILFD